MKAILIGLAAAALVLTAHAGSYSRPTSMSYDGRLVVAQQSGEVLVDGELAFTVPTEAIQESGLVGVLADGTDIYVFYYTPEHEGRISRFDSAYQETVLYAMPNSPGYGHVGGGLVIRDGSLYAGVGSQFPNENAQDPTVPWGKVIRIDLATGEASIYASGFRNPFTMATDGRNIYVNDVGEAAFEEVDLLVEGGNYGWPECEGACGTYIDPIYQYAHAPLPYAAITGGAFYHGTYYFADMVLGWVATMDGVVAEDVGPLIDLDVWGGTLYGLSITGGIVPVLTPVGGETLLPPPVTAVPVATPVKGPLPRLPRTGSGGSG